MADYWLREQRSPLTMARDTVFLEITVQERSVKIADSLPLVKIV
jgi:hypothetical protein